MRAIRESSESRPQLVPTSDVRALFENNVVTPQMRRYYDDLTNVRSTPKGKDPNKIYPDESLRASRFRIGLGQTIQHIQEGYNPLTTTLEMGDGELAANLQLHHVDATRIGQMLIETAVEAELYPTQYDQLRDVPIDPALAEELAEARSPVDLGYN